MKHIRKAIVRWAAKIAPSAKTPAQAVTAAAPRPLDDGQLRQIVGGDAGSTPQSPKGNW